MGDKDPPPGGRQWSNPDNVRIPMSTFDDQASFNPLHDAPISEVLRGSGKRYLDDLFPHMSVPCLACDTFKRPPASEGIRFDYERCGAHWVTKKKRPFRLDGGHCYECGQKIKKEPKKPKVWTWVREDS